MARVTNIQAWVRRVSKVAQVHAANDGVTLLAATSRLTKTAKKGHEMQCGPAVESWSAFCSEFAKIFEQKVPFYKAMQTIEARTWNHAKETFDQYAMDKLALIKRLDLPVSDTINLLIGGITINSLKATALAIGVTSIEDFLEKMRIIASSVSEGDYKNTKIFTRVNSKSRDPNSCRNCGRKGHTHHQCKSDSICFYCKGKGHRQYDCPQKKNLTAKSSPRPTTPSTAASVTAKQSTSDSSPDAPSEFAATVQHHDASQETRLTVISPLVEVCNLQRKDCELKALDDTGSPISFINNQTYEKYIKSRDVKLLPVDRHLTNLSKDKLSLLWVK